MYRTQRISLHVLCVVFFLGAVSAMPLQAQVYLDQLNLNPPDNGDLDQFGLSVATGGGRALVGSPFATVNGDQKGAAYSFRKTGGRWDFEYKFLSPQGALNDRFGASIGVDGVYAIIGAPREAQAGADAGGAHVFKRNLVSWQHFARLEASNAGAGDLFGTSVAIAGDLMVVGAPFEDSSGNDAGSVYIFRREGQDWIERQKISNPAFATPGDDQFGASVAISGTTIVVGAPRTEPNQRGAVYVYVPQGNSFALEDTIVASDLRDGDFFGVDVSIDGDDIVVGADLGDNGSDTNVGVAYTFKRQLTEWFPGQKLVHNGLSLDHFGKTVAIDGDLIVAGAYSEGDGAIYAFQRVDDVWGDPLRVGAEDAGAGQYFGFEVALDNGSAVTGAPRDDSDGANAGSAWEFELRGCREGGVDRLSGTVADVLFINGLVGDADRIVQISENGPIIATMAQPPGGGNGKYFVHANAEAPTQDTVTPLPTKLGAFCFQVLIGQGAVPLANWNGIGKEHKIGASMYFDGSPIADPANAPSLFLDLPSGDTQHLPAGTVVTLQGVIVDPGSVSPRGVSVTNAIIVEMQ